MSKSNRPLACAVAAAVIFVGAQLRGAAKPPAAHPNPAEAIFEDLRLPPLKGVRIELKSAKTCRESLIHRRTIRRLFQKRPHFR